MAQATEDQPAGKYVTEEKIKGLDFFFAIIGIVMSSVMIGVGHQVCEVFVSVRLLASFNSK